MDRREFLHITALGSAAGVLSFTGLGLVWEDAPGEGHSNSATVSPSTDAPSTSAAAPTTSPDDQYPTPTDTDAQTDTDTRTDTDAPTGTDRPSTTEPSPTATETSSSATTETSSSATTTPEPWREVNVRYRAYDENRKVYVNVENGNDYAVEVTVTISWGFEDGSETSETRIVELDAGAYWAGEVRAEAGERSVESWGHQHTVETL